MRSFVTFLAAAASLQGGSAAPFGNPEQLQPTISHGGFAHPTGGFPRPTGALRHWTKDEEHHRPTLSSGNWQGGDHWGFAHPTGHHFPHPSGGFPHPTERPGSGNGLWGRDADRTHPSSDGFAHPSGHHPHPTGGFPQPTGGSGHHHQPPPLGDDKEHGHGNWQANVARATVAGAAQPTGSSNQEKRDEEHHRPTGVAGPSGLLSVLAQHRPAATVAAGQHPEAEPKRERAVLQEVPRVVRDAN
ncbi:hypothetical protein F4811DRAFT_505926 [Daldinia bambusicola]|nr:hypothetical protein F4811DRAFT_505926 [Daldinia bambusicola]